MSDIDKVIEYLKEYSTPATIKDNDKDVKGRLVNLASLPKNIEDAMTKFLGTFNPNKLQLLFIGDDGKFTFIKDVVPKSSSGEVNNGIVEFEFATHPLHADPRKIY